MRVPPDARAARSAGAAQSPLNPAAAGVAYTRPRLGHKGTAMRILLSAILLSLLAACGQTGPLYLTTPGPKMSTVSRTTVGDSLVAVSTVAGPRPISSTP